MSSIPTVGDGFLAEVKVEGHHLRLFSEVYEMGHRAVVYDVNAKREIARIDADSLDEGKRKAEESAWDYLKHQHGIAQIPIVSWQMNRQTSMKQKRDA